MTTPRTIDPKCCYACYELTETSRAFASGDDNREPYVKCDHCPRGANLSMMVPRHDGTMECPYCRDSESKNASVRTFETGATRDTDQGKLDFEAFLSPRVLHRYAEYMHKHRQQSDGSLRPGDNWQKGIPVDQYAKSLLRHIMDVWLLHRGEEPIDSDNIEEALCAILFNAMGMLFELIKDESAESLKDSIYNSIDKED